MFLRRVAGWLLRLLARRITEQEADRGPSSDAEVVFVGEQLIEGLGVVFRVRPRLDLLVGVVADADEHDEALRFGILRGAPGRASWQCREQHGEPTET